MPRFKFNLQRVLEIRKHKEELLKNELAALRREHTHEESVLRELEARHLRYLNQIREKQASSSISSEEMLWYYAYIEYLDSSIERQKTKLRELEQKIELTKAKLIAATKEKKVLEKLRERRFEEFKLEEEKIDQAFMDEIALSMYTRQASQLSYRR